MGTNGIISFQRGFYYWWPSPFPTYSHYIQSRYVVAPFWSDNDIRITGDICYEVHERVDASTAIVSEYISHNTGTNFKGRWMLVAQWENVHPYPHGSQNYWWWSWYGSRYVDFASKVGFHLYCLTPLIITAIII